MYILELSVLSLHSKHGQSFWLYLHIKYWNMCWHTHTHTQCGPSNDSSFHSECDHEIHGLTVK